MSDFDSYQSHPLCDIANDELIRNSTPFLIVTVRQEGIDKTQELEVENFT